MIGKEERDAVMRVMQSGCLSNYQGNWSEAFWGGPEIQALEREWAEYFGVKHAIACNSATSGLWMACAAIGLQNGSDPLNDCAEVIVTPYSMTCSASIPLHFGAKPIFADIEPDYFCLDPVSVERKITEWTRAIIVVDLFGQVYDADAINAIAEKYSKIHGHKIYVIEDAAQAIGARYKGRHAGTLGDIGIYSLNRHKHIQCGEGGVVVTNDDQLAVRLRLAMNHSEAVINDGMRKQCMTSKEWEKDVSLVGMNLRMTELSAAIAREQLKKLDNILSVYRECARFFSIKVRPECEHAYYRYASTDDRYYMEEGTVLSNDIIGSVEFNEKRHYITPIYKMPLFRSLGYPDHLCPVCEDVEENIILAWLKEVP